MNAAEDARLSDRWLAVMLEEMHMNRPVHPTDVHKVVTELLASRAAIEQLTRERDEARAALRQCADDLQAVGDDYPGSSCQMWCREKADAARAALGSSLPTTEGK